MNLKYQIKRPVINQMRNVPYILHSKNDAGDFFYESDSLPPNLAMLSVLNLC